MSSLPCLNPNCKSHGRPHPNCRCHPEELAEGGAVTLYCAKGMPHMPECEYFADGGEIPAPPAGFMDEANQAPPPPEGFSEDASAPPPPEGFAEEARGVDNEKYDTFGQKMLTAVEGGARSISAGMSDVAMSKARGYAEQHSDNPDFWAPKMEDVAGRREHNPVLAHSAEMAGLAASLLRGRGAPALMAKLGRTAADAVGAVSVYGKIGAAALAGAIESGMLQGGDEISKAMLGQKGGDPAAATSSVIANIGAAALLGGGLNGIASSASQRIKAIAQSKSAKNAADQLANMGAQWHLTENPELAMHIADAGGGQMLGELANSEGGKLAQSLRPEQLTTNVVDKASRAAGALVGHKTGNELLGVYAGGKLAPLIEKIIGVPVRKGSHIVVNAAMKALASGETNALHDLIDYANKVHAGQRSIKMAVDGLFKPGREFIIDQVLPRENQRLEEFIDNGGVNQFFKELEAETQPAFAQGGIVNDKPKNDAIATHYPEQNMLLSAAKGRISNYLTGLKPQKNKPKLSFDKDHHDPQEEKAYKSAISIANKPLSVLNKVKDGTLKIDDLKHLVSMYPDLHDHLSKKLTERIMNAQMDDEKPSYKVRQAMSLFLGAPLDSTMTPSSIQNIQATFQANAQQRQSPQSANSTKSLSKTAKGFQTPEQANERRDVERSK